ncbi:MAG: T9SS type A sorting domain-containing protein [Bacteroidota bacterium]
MCKRLFYLLSVLLISISQLCLASSGKYGNLIRIRIDNQIISPADTIGKWNKFIYDNGYGYSEDLYYDHFRFSDKSYFLKEYNNVFESPVFSQLQGNFRLNNLENLTLRNFAWTGVGWDAIPQYFIKRTQILETLNGIWLLNGNLGKGFLSGQDSLFYYNPTSTDSSFSAKLIHVLGKVSGKYLCAFFDGNIYGAGYQFYLADLSSSPFIDSSLAIKVEFPIPWSEVHNEPRKIVNLTQDLYLIQRAYGMYIYRFDGKSFQYIKQIPVDDYYFSSPYERSPDDDLVWNYRNNHLYLYADQTLSSYDFINADTSFTRGNRIFSRGDYADIGMDRALSYAALLNSNKLDIYDITNASVIKSFDVSSFSGLSNPVIDTPYVFVHQITRTTAVEQNERLTPANYRLLTAYPNPFNSAATIRYALPEDENIEINIYDMLGRRIRCLFKGNVKRGEHEYFFDASDLSSGMYIYTVESKDFRMANKIVLMK